MDITKLFRSALAIGALCIGIAQSAKADIVTWTGDTTGGATVDLTVFDLDGTAVPYKALPFTVSTSDIYTFMLTGAYDTVIMLYENAFDAGNPEANFLTGNDDDVWYTTSSIVELLSADTTYVLVITGFDNPEFGQYSVTIGGPGMITAVPEPSTWIMLALGLATVGYAQRRKSKR